MRLRHSFWLKVAVAAAVACVFVLAGGESQASNMGFKMNKVIVGKVAASNNDNWVALPYRHPYQNSQDVCNALGLTGGVGQGKVIRLDPANGAQDSDDCETTGSAGAFPLVAGVADHLKRAGLIVSNPTNAGGIIVGSHQSNTGPGTGTITLKPKAVPSPKGDNYFPVPYHTTSVFAEDLCTDLGLPGSAASPNAKVFRRNTNAGDDSWDCHPTSGLGFPLVLGEAVKIQYQGSDIVVATGHPAHF